MADEEIIDVDADALSIDWIKTVYADVGVELKDVEGLPAELGVKIRDAREGAPVEIIDERQEFHLAGKHDQKAHGRKSKVSPKGGGPKVLPWKEPPAPRGKAGGKAGGFSATGRTNTMVGDTAEAALEQLGFESALPEGKRQGPFDVKCCDGWEFEVKALTTDSAEYKIKMKGSELRSKKASAKKRGVKAGSLMVIMDYKKGQAHAYWKEGLGNFRLNKTWNYAGTAELGEAA